MKLLICVTLAAMLAVSQAQLMIYSPWGACDPATCTQSRSVVTCVGAGCAFAPLLGMLTCQSCVNTTIGCGANSLPTNWQGVYTVRAGRCNAGAGPSVSLSCCCMDTTSKVYVRQYDELVEITFPDGISMSGPGCNVVAPGSPIPPSVLFSPKGVSFKTVDPRVLVNGVPVNAGTYVNGVQAKNGVTPVPGTDAPNTIASAGTVTLFGRSYRAIRTCNSIYFFGVAGFSSTDNPFCVQELNFDSPLASY